MCVWVGGRVRAPTTDRSSQRQNTMDRREFGRREERRRGERGRGNPSVVMRGPLTASGTGMALGAVCHAAIPVEAEPNDTPSSAQRSRG